MAHSVGFNIPAAKCDCTAKQTMQHTKTHTQEREKKKENSAGCFLYTIYLFLCVCALRVCERYEIWGLRMANSYWEWKLFERHHTGIFWNFFSCKYNFTLFVVEKPKFYSNRGKLFVIFNNAAYYNATRNGSKINPWKIFYHSNSNENIPLILQQNIYSVSFQTLKF